MTNTTNDYLINTLYVNANPNIHLFEGRIANYFENVHLDFGIIILNMTNSIYASHDQAEFLRVAKESCNINMTYLPINLIQMPNIRYGFPKDQKETFFIVDHRENPIKKYVYSGDFAAINEVQQFCDSYKKGELKQFYKSGTIESERYTNIDDYDSTNVLDFINSSEFSVLGIYYTSDDSLVNYSTSIKTMQKESSTNDIRNKVKFGQFSIAYNDWPGVNTSFLPLPRVLIFEKGNLIVNKRAEYVDDIIKYVSNAVNHVPSREEEEL